MSIIPNPIQTTSNFYQSKPSKFKLSKHTLSLHHLNTLKSKLLKSRLNRVSNPMYERFSNSQSTINALDTYLCTFTKFSKGTWMDFDGRGVKERFDKLKKDLEATINVKGLKRKADHREIKEKERKVFLYSSYDPCEKSIRPNEQNKGSKKRK